MSCVISHSGWFGSKMATASSPLSNHANQSGIRDLCLCLNRFWFSSVAATQYLSPVKVWRVAVSVDGNDYVITQDIIFIQLFPNLYVVQFKVCFRIS